MARACTWLLNAPTWIAPNAAASHTDINAVGAVAGALAGGTGAARWSSEDRETQQPRERPGWRGELYTGKDGTDRKRHLDRTNWRSSPQLVRQPPVCG